MQETFNQAVWRHAKKDFIAGLGDRRKMVVNGVFGICSTAAAVFLIAPDTYAEKVTIAAFTLLAALTLSMLFHALWSWVSAPRAIYSEQQGEIAALKAEESSLLAKLNDREATSHRSALSRASYDALVLQCKEAKNYSEVQAVKNAGCCWLREFYGEAEASDFSDILNRVLHDKNFDRCVNATEARQRVLADAVALLRNHKPIKE